MRASSCVKAGCRIADRQICREAGARCYGEGGRPFDEDTLTGRHFAAIRAIGNVGEDNATAQDRLIAQMFTAIDADPEYD